MHTLTPDNIFTEGVNWGISYDLPNESKPELDPFLQLRKDSVKPSKYLDKYDGDKFSGNYKPNDVVWNNEDKLWTLDERKKKKKYTKADYHYLQRRYRRDLYNKMETVINAWVEGGLIVSIRLKLPTRHFINDWYCRFMKVDTNPNRGPRGRAD